MSTFFIVFVLSFVSFMHFSVSTESHYRQLYGKRQVPKTEFLIYQSIAWIVLSASLIFPIQLWGVGIGIMAWLLIITLGALLVVALVNFLPNTYQFVWKWVGFSRKWVPFKEF